MTNSEFLSSYRETIQELRVLEYQLELCGSNGRPAGVASVDYARVRSSTNDRDAADRQRYDGLTQSYKQLQQHLASMEPRFQELCKRARNFKERHIIKLYYQELNTDAAIAELLNLSVRHVNRLRHNMLYMLDRD